MLLQYDSIKQDNFSQQIDGTHHLSQYSFQKQESLFCTRQCQKQHLDLPYRHYINKSNYIASNLHHGPEKFNLKGSVKLMNGIGHSSIMQRRFLEKINLNNIYFHSKPKILVNSQ